MDINFFIVPISGAIIGYTTNWLAIKMIFKPHEPKYFFGLKIPFTPGLIVKERSRIASKIGTTLEKEILTKEELSSYFENAELDKSIDDFIQDFIQKSIKNDDQLTLQKLIDSNLDINSNEKLKFFIEEKIINYVQKDEFKLKCNVILEKLYDALKDDSVIEKINNVIKEITKDFLDKKWSYLETEEFEQFIDEKLSYVLSFWDNNEKTLEEQFRGASVEVKRHIKFNLNMYCENTVEYLSTEKSEDFHKEMKIVLKKIASSNLNPMIIGFVNIDSLYQNGISKFCDYLEDEDNYKEILYYIDGLVNKIFEQRVDKALNNLPKTYIKESISKYIINSINDDDIKNKILNKTKLDKEYLNQLVFNNKDSINNYVYNFLKNAIEKNYSIISQFISNQILSLRVLNLLETFDLKVTNIKNFDKMVLGVTDFIIDKMDVAQIVETKINDIETKKVEELVLSVMEKELAHITSLGGLLGFIIGLCTLLI